MTQRNTTGWFNSEAKIQDGGQRWQRLVLTPALEARNENFFTLVLSCPGSLMPNTNTNANASTISYILSTWACICIMLAHTCVCLRLRLQCSCEPDLPCCTESSLCVNINHTSIHSSSVLWHGCQHAEHNTELCLATPCWPSNLQKGNRGDKEALWLGCWTWNKEVPGSRSPL